VVCLPHDSLQLVLLPQGIFIDCQETAGIDKNRSQLIEVIFVEPEEKQGGLSGNGDAHLVGHFQPGATPPSTSG